MENKFKVYVVGGGYEYIQLLYSQGYGGAKGLGDADVVLFTGGEDVTPQLYGEKPLNTTNFNVARDEREKIIYDEALKASIPMVGICRGGQFLNVMNGGKMFQHVDGHCGTHDMMIPGDPNRVIKVTSTHHQMMIPNPETALVLAVASQARSKQSYGYSVETLEPSMDDTEVIWYDKTSCLCFQPHPEFLNAPKECKDYFDECMSNFVIPATYGRIAA